MTRHASLPDDYASAIANDCIHPCWWLFVHCCWWLLGHRCWWIWVNIPVKTSSKTCFLDRKWRRYSCFIICKICCDYWDIAADDYWDISANGFGWTFQSKQSQKHVFWIGNEGDTAVPSSAQPANDYLSIPANDYLSIPANDYWSIAAGDYWSIAAGHRCQWLLVHHCQWLFAHCCQWLLGHCCKWIWPKVHDLLLLLKIQAHFIMWAHFWMRGHFSQGHVLSYGNTRSFRDRKDVE